MKRREFNQLIVGAAIAQALFRGHAETLVPTGEQRFSVMLWALGKQTPFERLIEIVAAAGYRGVELVGEFKKWSPQDTRRILAQMSSLGLIFDAMSGVDAGFAVPGESSEFLKQLTEQIRWAKDLACPQVILLSGKRVDGIGPNAQHSTSVENLKRASDLAAKEHIELVIEPIDPLENPSIYLASVSEGFRIVREVASEHVKVLYDFYHEQRAFGNLIEKLENNIEWVGLVHIADVPGRHEPGTGEIDYISIYRKLAALKYNKFITMEYYPTEDPLASLKKARLSALQALHAG